MPGARAGDDHIVAVESGRPISERVTPGSGLARRVARRHGRCCSVMVTTPRQVIDSAVRSACGHGVERLVRLTGGGMNETYRVELAGVGSVVVRIARQPVPWFTDEAHIMARARAVGVPTAEVLGVEHVEQDGELLSFSIQRMLPGRSLDDLAGELPPVDL